MTIKASVETWKLNPAQLRPTEMLLPWVTVKGHAMEAIAMLVSVYFLWKLVRTSHFLIVRRVGFVAC